MLWGLVIHILLPAAVLARTHQIRSHGPIAKLLKSKAMSLGDGQFQNVQPTWYSTDTGSPLQAAPVALSTVVKSASTTGISCRGGDYSSGSSNGRHARFPWPVTGY
ncbi:hypothetical protein B0H14DRAFT_2567310 [Mycena olivaceomarginata]|nr:hypothetical protein B0H14DRAFT_2567310 [Mycena olivaceomarginata]